MRALSCSSMRSTASLWLMCRGSYCSVWTSFGCFLEAFFWVSTVAVPSILYRVDAVSGRQSVHWSSSLNGVLTRRCVSAQ